MSEQIEINSTVEETTDPTVEETPKINSPAKFKSIQLKTIELAHKDYKELYSIIEKFVQDNGELTPVNITLCITKIMMFVQRIGGLNGEQKKELVIYTINDYISQIDNEELKFSLLTFSELFLPSFIDTIVDVNNKKIIIKSIKSCCSSIKNLFK